MKRMEFGLLVASVIAISITVSACSRKVRYTRTDAPVVRETVVVKKTGPPPHAPAHGYRHKHSDGAVLEYESSLRVYVVTGYPHHYFYKSKYYRLHDGAWEVSLHLDGPWKSVHKRKLPRGLKKKRFKGKGWK